MKTFNRKGDRGETSLLGGVRVSKADARCEAYGTIDEAVSCLGLAKGFCQAEVVGILSTLQQDLFMVAGELATPAEPVSQSANRASVVKPEMVQRLEDLIEDIEAKVTMPRGFVIPGACRSSAALDVARTVIRRAERRVVSLREAGQPLNQELLSYLNRLADLVFALARYQDKVGDGDNPGY